MVCLASRERKRSGKLLLLHRKIPEMAQDFLLQKGGLQAQIDYQRAHGFRKVSSEETRRWFLAGKVVLWHGINAARLYHRYGPCATG